MNKSKLDNLFSEIISLDKNPKNLYDFNHSQNYKAVTPNCQNWLFFRPNTATGAGEKARFQYALTKCRQLLLWLTLQNKPFGEYVRRYLCKPRVRPQHPFRGISQLEITKERSQ